MPYRIFVRLALLAVAMFAGCVSAPVPDAGRPESMWIRGAQFQEDNSNSISVKAFGASGADNNDDTTAFESALTAASVAAASGKSASVYVPSGTWLLSRTLSLPPNVKLFGDGPGSILKLMDASSTGLSEVTTDLLVPPTYNPLLMPSQTGGPHAGIVVSDLAIDFNGTNQTNWSSSASGLSHANITTQNSTGMLVKNVRSYGGAGLGIAAPANRRHFCFFAVGNGAAPTEITASASYTNATFLINQTGIGATCAVGDRVRFTAAGTGAIFTETDFYVRVVAADVLTLNRDINGSSGDIAAGQVAGFVYHDQPESAGVSYAAKFDNCFGEDGGYDTFGVRSIYALHTQVSNCTFEAATGGRSACQVYDRSPFTTFTNCVFRAITLPQPIATASQTAVILHAARGTRFDGCTFLSNDSNALAIFGDNTAGFSEANVSNGNFAEDIVISNSYMENSGSLSGQSTVGFSSTPEYIRRITLEGNRIVYSGGVSNANACISIADVAAGGISILNNFITSNSHSGTINMTQASTDEGSGEILIAGNEIWNTTTSFAAAAPLVLNGRDSSVIPQNITVTGNKLFQTDTDSRAIQITDVCGLRFTGNSISIVSASQPTVAAVYINDGNDIEFSENTIYSSSTSAEPVILLSGDVDYIRVRGNKVHRQRGNTTQPAYGIGVPDSSTYIEISGNDLSRCATSAWFTTFFTSAGTNTGSRVAQNITATTGDATFTSGTGTITTTSLAITHNLKYWRALRPSDIVVYFTEDPTTAPATIWISGISSTQFTVNVEVDPGASDLDLAWSARMETP